MSNPDDNEILRRAQQIADLQPDPQSADRAAARARDSVLQTAQTPTTTFLRRLIMRKPLPKIAAAVIIDAGSMSVERYGPA